MISEIKRIHKKYQAKQSSPYTSEEISTIRSSTNGVVKSEILGKTVKSFLIITYGLVRTNMRMDLRVLIKLNILIKLFQ